jgi:integrase
LKRATWTKPSHHTKQKTVHSVPLSPDALRVLKRRKKSAAGQHVFPGDVADEPLKDLKNPWKRACTIAKLPPVRLHDLRHSYASHLVSNGVSLPIVGQLLGHTNPLTTARYAHLSDDALRAATNSFGKALAAAAGKK